MQKFGKFCPENATHGTFDVEISLAKGIIFRKIGLANGAILKPWAAHPCPKFSREPPPPHPWNFPENHLLWVKAPKCQSKGCYWWVVMTKRRQGEKLVVQYAAAQNRPMDSIATIPDFYFSELYHLFH